MHLGRITGLHCSHVRIPTNLDLLKLLLLIEVSENRVSTHGIAVLIDSDSAGKRELPRLVLKSSLGRFDCSRSRTNATGCLWSIDGLWNYVDLNIVLQIQAL